MSVGRSSNAEEQPEEEVMEEEELEEDEVEAARTDFEEEFDFKRYLMSYAKPEVLKAYVVLAGDFESNSVHTNHCVVKMLHRVAFDLGYIAMLFQASLFRVFQKVMLGPAAHTSKFKEWCTFGMHVMRKFSEVAQKNKKVFMEMMFWKGSKEALQITEGYDYNPGNAKVAWTEDEENELMRLFEDFRGAENPEMDTVDMILGQWSGSSKTRGQIIRHLKVLRLITGVKDLRRKPESVRVWTADDEQELQEAFHTHKDSYDPLTNILESLSKKRSKVKVTEKLLAMGVVEDKKQLYKKRRGKSRGNEGRTERVTGTDDEDDSCNERDMGSDVGGGWEEGGLPSDEEILSSPAGSEVSSDDDSDNGNDSLETSLQAPDEVSSSSSSSSDNVKMLKNVVDKGYKEQVLWIHRLLGQNAKTRHGQETAVSVPIVPLTEDNETAMEDPVFTDFLQRLGLSPPASEQEMFWRIPASLTAANLQTIAEGLELDEDGEPVNQRTLLQLQPLTPRPSSSSTKKKEKKKKKKRQHDKTHKADKGKRKKAPKRAEKKERKKKAASVQSDPDDDSSQSDPSDGEDHQRRTGSDVGDDSAGSRSKGKGPSASQRREALKAMLERRKVKKVLNRQRTRPGEAGGDDQPIEEASQGTSAETSVSSQRPPSVASSPPSSTQKNRKRVRRAVDSDSNSDDNMETDQKKAEDRSPPPRSTKRIRLLGSDLSDDDDNKENRDNSALNYQSDEEVDASQSQSQGLLDFGDDSDMEERKEKGNADGDESSDDDVPLMAAVKRKEAPESFPATMLSQGTLGSEDSDLDDHVTLGALKKKRKVISDDEDD